MLAPRVREGSRHAVAARGDPAGRYIGNRPVKLRKSAWKDRDVKVVKKKEKIKAAVEAGAKEKKMTATRFKVQFS